MIINHNMSALIASHNNNKVNDSSAKTKEKLTTGLRVNRAGDDPSGLAISETMRREIRGLDQASRNSQDGISLIQTAEAALTETHSILQRMRELAVQAANDVYCSNDRMQMQKEIDQLKENIDQFAATTSFNGKKLLDGTATALATTDNQSTKVFLRDPLETLEVSKQATKIEGTYRIDIAADSPGTPQTQSSNMLKVTNGTGPLTALDVNAASGLVPTAATGFDYYHSYGVSTENNAGTGMVTSTAYEQQSAMTSPNANSTFFTTNANAPATITAGSQYSGSVLVEVTGVNPAPLNTIIARVQGHFVDDITGAPVDFDQTGVTLDMNAPFSNTIFSMSTPVSFTILNNDSNPLGGIDPVNPQYAVGDKTVIGISGSIGTGVTYDAIQIEASYSRPGAVSSYPTAGKVVNRYVVNDNVLNNQTTTFKFYSLNTDKTSGAYGTVYDGSLALKIGTIVSADPAAAFDFMPQAGQLAMPEAKLKDIDKFYDSSGRFLFDIPQTLTLIQGNGARTNVTFVGTDTIQDVLDKFNAAIADQLGQGKYVSGNDLQHFVSWDSTKGMMYLSSAIAGPDGQIHLVSDEAVLEGFGLSEVQKSAEGQFTVNVTDAFDPSKFIAQNVKTCGNMLIGVVNPDVDVKFDGNADTTATYNPLTRRFELAGDPANTYTTCVNLVDNRLVLQVGANEMQHIGAAIGNMSSESLGVANVLVTDKESAGQTIGKVDGAIDRVSSQRSSLGTVQNRLEHIIKSLDVNSESETATESRIRDTDMAATLMESVKLDILSQSGMAVLAQANQHPQLILQLLNKE